MAVSVSATWVPRTSPDVRTALRTGWKHREMAAPVAEIEIGPDLVRGLLDEQHSDLSALPLRRLSSGWDNEIFRLGDELTVRLPRRLASAHLVLHEHRWLPELAPRLPLPISAPLRRGAPSNALGYPWHWTVGAWLPGEDAERRPPDDAMEAAAQLGGFLAALHRPAPPGAPANPYRGVPLLHRDTQLRAQVAELGDVVDTAAIVARWNALIDAPPWPHPKVWLHGDPHPLNLLVHDGRLSAVIDFGDICAGDPSSDLSAAWALLPAEARPAFRQAAAPGGVDDDTWRRAQAWAIALGVSYSLGDDRVAAIGRRMLDAVLHDDGR